MVRIHLQKVAATWGYWGQRSEILHGPLYGQYTCHIKIQAQSEKKNKFLDTLMVILYPAYRNWEGLLMYQLFVRVQRWRPIPLRQLFYPVFVIPRCSAPLAWHTDWHRCLDTRWVGLCSSLSQGKFLCCSRLPQTRVDCVTHVTHWDTIARQVNSSENENLSTLWFVFASLYVIWGNLDRTTRNIYLGSLFCLPTVLYLYLNRGINIVQQSGVYLFIISSSNVLGTN